MAVNTKFVVGYGGGAKISSLDASGILTPDKYVPITGGSLERKQDIGFVTSYHIPYSTAPRSRIRLNTGTYSFSGSISFQLTSRLSGIIISQKFFNRNNMFAISMCDGDITVTMKRCMWTSLSIQGSPNSPISCSLSFVSTNNNSKDWSTTTTLLSSTLASEDALQPYWTYGSSNDNVQVVQSFSLNFSRNVTPVYLNNDKVVPTYLRPGMLQVDMQINCQEKWFDLGFLTLGSKTITFNDYYMSQQTFQYSGLTQPGSKTFVVKGTAASTEEVFEIS